MAAVDNTLGALLIGVILAATLWGVCCVQAWHYFQNYSNDRWYLKALVAAVLVSDTVHQILISQTVYAYTISYYGVPSELGQVVPAIVIEVLFNGITAVMVQGFFIWRIYKLSNDNLIITGIVALLVAGELCSVVLFFAKGIKMTTFVQIATIKSVSMCINILGAAGDIVIAATMCYLLQTSKTGFKKSDTVVTRLMVYVINTGLLTSLDAVASLVSILASPNTFIYICFFFTLGRLYSNSLFATLNARSAIRAAVAEDADDEFSLSFARSVPGAGGTAMGARSVGGKTIEQMQAQGKMHSQTFVVVERSTELHTDRLYTDSIVKHDQSV